MKSYFDKVYKGGAQEFGQELNRRLAKEEKTFVVTANPETFMMGVQNPEFDRVLNNPRTIIVPDGIGIVKGARMLGYAMQERVAGVDIVQRLFKYASEQKKSVYLFGAKREVLERLIGKLKAEYPGLLLAGYSHGYVKDRDRIFRDIIAKKPDIVLVALGIPAQELLIDKYYDMFSKGIFVGVGGSFDVLSGTKKRAPGFFIRLNLEWLYRIGQEPKRFQRFYQSNIKYLSELKKLKRKLKKKE